MAAYYPTTFRALPLRNILFQELIHTVIFYKFEVLNHAHVVKVTIALVESFQPETRKITAIVTEPHKSLSQQFTMPFVMTVLTALQAAGAICLAKTLMPKFVLHRQVAGAQAAVHTAGSD